MFKRLSKPLILCLLPLPTIDHDKVSRDSKTAKSFYTQRHDDETGWDRIHMMFSFDEFGSVSPELNTVYQATYLGMFTGACLGGFLRSRAAYIEFMERNQATTFTSHLEAKKKLQDTVTLNMGKGAFQWGWRLAAFSGCYVLVTTTISVYRGKSGIMEYMAAGGLTGAVYKANLGVRGMLVGGGLGAVLGAVAGGLSLAALSLSGTSMEEVRFWQYKWKTSRQRAEQDVFRKAQEEKDDPLEKHHKAKIGEIPNDLQPIPAS